MKLAYLTSVYARSTDSFIRSEVRALRELGWEVSTFSIRSQRADASISEEIRQEQNSTFYILEQGFSRLFIAFWSELLRSPLGFFRALRLGYMLRRPGVRGHLLAAAYFLEAACLAKEIRRKQIDHLHNHIGENSAAVAMLASELSGVPYSLTIHGPSEFDHPQNLRLDLKISRSAFTVAISQFTRSQILRWIEPSLWSKVCVVGCGVEDDFCRAVNKEMPANRFLSVGRMVEQKGHAITLFSLVELKARGYCPSVSMVGDGPLLSDLKQLADDLGLHSQVEFCGALSKNEVRDLIIGATAFVLPSFAEGLPVALMEAMALGRPVISTYIAGIPELVQHGVNGWLIPAGSIGGLADAMEHCLSTDLDRLLAMGRSGREYVAANHEQTQQAVKLAAMFQRSVGQRQSRIASTVRPRSIVQEN